jgi:hypothetical protein
VGFLPEDSNDPPVHVKVRPERPGALDEVHLPVGADLRDVVDEVVGKRRLPKPYRTPDGRKGTPGIDAVDRPPVGRPVLLREVQVPWVG